MCGELELVRTGVEPLAACYRAGHAEAERVTVCRISEVPVNRVVIKRALRAMSSFTERRTERSRRVHCRTVSMRLIGRAEPRGPTFAM